MKMWYSKSFRSSFEGEITTQLLAFANKHKLLPGELIVVENHEKVGVKVTQILYYSISKLK